MEDFIPTFDRYFYRMAVLVDLLHGTTPTSSPDAGLDPPGPRTGLGPGRQGLVRTKTRYVPSWWDTS